MSLAIANQISSQQFGYATIVGEMIAAERKREEQQGYAEKNFNENKFIEQKKFEQRQFEQRQYERAKTDFLLYALVLFIILQAKEKFADRLEERKREYYHEYYVAEVAKIAAESATGTKNTEEPFGLQEINKQIHDREADIYQKAQSQVADQTNVEIQECDVELDAAVDEALNNPDKNQEKLLEEMIRLEDEIEHLQENRDKLIEEIDDIQDTIEAMKYELKEMGPYDKLSSKKQEEFNMLNQLLDKERAKVGPKDAALNDSKKQLDQHKTLLADKNSEYKAMIDASVGSNLEKWSENLLKIFQDIPKKIATIVERLIKTDNSLQGPQGLYAKRDEIQNKVKIDDQKKKDEALRRQQEQVKENKPNPTRSFKPKSGSTS